MRLLVAWERTLRSRGYDLIFARHEYSSRLQASELTLPRMLEQEGAVDEVILAGIHDLNLLQLLLRGLTPTAILACNDELSAGESV